LLQLPAAIMPSRLLPAGLFLCGHKSGLLVKVTKTNISF